MSLGFALAEQGHVVQSHYPQSGAAAATINGDVMSMKNHVRAEFHVALGATDSTAPDGLLTVEACDDFTPSNVVAIPFRLYKDEVGSKDVLDAGTEILAAGYAIKDVANITYLVQVLDEHLPEGKPNVRLVIKLCSGGTVTEVSAVANLTGSRSAAAKSPTAIE